MNIGLFTDTYFPQINGVATSVYTLATALEKKGHTVTIFTPSDPGSNKNESSNIMRMPSMPFLLLKNFRVGMIYSPLTLNKISHLHLDIVHTQTEFPLGMFGKFLSSTHKIPMVHTYHTMYEDYVHYIAHGILVTPTMAKDFSKLFCNSANAVVAPTEKAKHFLEEYGVTKPIYTIPTGINTSLFEKSNFDTFDIENLKKSFDLKKDTQVILSLGRIAKEKSIDIIINAMPNLLKRLPDAKLVIVGDGPEKNKLMELVNTLNISQNVIFTGAKPWSEIGKYYQLGNVFVSASISETQGLTFAEAMAGGIPVIAKKDESIENIIEDNVTGLLFETNEELCEKLYTLLTDKPLYDRLVSAGTKKIQDLSVLKFADNMEALYENILYKEANGEKKLPAAMLPVMAGVHAVKWIGGIPKSIVRKGLLISGTSIGRLPKANKPKTIDNPFDETSSVISRKIQHFKQSGATFQAMFEDGRKLSEKFGKENVYDFSIGNPSVFPPKSVASAINKILQEEIPTLVHGYTNTSGFLDVRQKIADVTNKEFSTNYNENNFIMTCGAAGALNIVFKVLLNPHDEVITFAPYFGDYEPYVENYDGKLIPILTDDKTFMPDMEKLSRAINKKTKAILINSPNNPTGVIYPEKVIKEIAELLKRKEIELRHPIYLIADEPYRRLAYDGIKVSYVPNFYTNTIVCDSFSKSISLAGQRIGYITVPTKVSYFEEIIESLNIANRVSGFINASSLFQRVVPYCINEICDLSVYDTNRKYLYNMLIELGYECSYPEGAFYLFPKSLIQDDEKFCKIAQKYRLVIVPGSAFGMSGHFRISYCVPLETIKQSYKSFKSLAERLYD